MVRKSKILQVVGFQNSGKTTVVSELVSKLSAEGLSVGTIKHHGHHTNITIGDEAKDTGLHRKAGALTTCVEGNGMIQLTSRHSNALRLEVLIQIYEMLNHDCILIEGYKREKYPKVLLLQRKEDLQLLTELDNVVAVIRWDDADMKIDHTRVFEMDKLPVFLKWATLYVRGDKSNG